jgi:glutathione S-transferase
MSRASRVHLVREFAVPAAAVFEAWLDPAVLGAFIKPAPGVSVADTAVDARVGGGFSLTLVIGETRIPIRGAYHHIDRYTRLAFTWLSSRTQPDSLVTLDFEALGRDRTRLTLVHTGFPDAEARDDHDGGWALILSQLENVTAGR